MEFKTRASPKTMFLPEKTILKQFRNNPHKISMISSCKVINRKSNASSVILSKTKAAT